MKEQTTLLWSWMWRHRVWSSIILIVLLAFGGYWTINLVRFGLPPPRGENCGTLHHGGGADQTERADESLLALTCFWQVYQTCRAATIIQIYAPFDIWDVITVTIERRGNGCATYGQEELQVSGTPNTTNTTFLCTQVSREGDALHFSACDGRTPFVLVPRDVINESFPCGGVGTPYAGVYDVPQQIESCFFAAYQHCLADSMGYETLQNGVKVESDFYIDNHCGIAYRRGSYSAACSSLEMRAEGLYFSRCGTDGNIFVPIDTSSS